MITKQYTCDCCGYFDRPVQVEDDREVVPLPDDWQAHSIDGTEVHLCPDCNQAFKEWMHTFFECDQI